MLPVPVPASPVLFTKVETLQWPVAQACTPVVWQVRLGLALVKKVFLLLIATTENIPPVAEQKHLAGSLQSL